MNLRAFQSRELGIRRGRTGVFEIQNSCMTRRVELFPLPEDLTPQPRRLRHGAGGRRAGDHVEELFTIKSEGQGQSGRSKRLLLTQCPGVVWVPDTLRSEFL